MAKTEQFETGQYLTFNLSEEVFAFDITKVREVLEFSKVTKVPQTPAMMIGVINLRGSVVPIIDLRLKFNMEKGDLTVNTCIIIIETITDQETLIIGALVDSVQEVMDLDSEHIEAPPKIGTKLNTDFIKGMGKVEDQFVIILNIEKIFNTDELAMVQQAAEGRTLDAAS
jgi:purine-binding chemotaxis protein CheW